jgi:hypothetical protein
MSRKGNARQPTVQREHRANAQSPIADVRTAHRQLILPPFRMLNSVLDGGTNHSDDISRIAQEHAAKLVGIAENTVALGALDLPINEAIADLASVSALADHVGAARDKVESGRLSSYEYASALQHVIGRLYEKWSDKTLPDKWEAEESGRARSARLLRNSTPDPDVARAAAGATEPSGAGPVDRLMLLRIDFEAQLIPFKLLADVVCDHAADGEQPADPMSFELAHAVWGLWARWETFANALRGIEEEVHTGRKPAHTHGGSDA